METIKSNFLRIVIPTFRMHTQLFNNVLEGINETDAKYRVKGNTNHIVWMADNMVNARFWLAKVLNLAEEDPHESLFKDAKALNENYLYPTLDALLVQWHKISPSLLEKLRQMSDEELLLPCLLGMETLFIDENYLNAIGMCIDREAYLMGQLGLMRKILGYDAMQYHINEDISY